MTSVAPFGGQPATHQLQQTQPTSVHAGNKTTILRIIVKTGNYCFRNNVILLTGSWRNPAFQGRVSSVVVTSQPVLQQQPFPDFMRNHTHTRAVIYEGWADFLTGP